MWLLADVLFARELNVEGNGLEHPGALICGATPPSASPTSLLALLVEALLSPLINLPTTDFGCVRLDQLRGLFLACRDWGTSLGGHAVGTSSVSLLHLAIPCLNHAEVLSLDSPMRMESIG